MQEINVTKTYLPPIKVYNKYLKTIWKSGWVTNKGPLVLELEDKLKKYLGVKYLFLVTNGTIGLQIAIKALGLKGEIITTPFSYVASTSSIVWEGCKPVFVDIDPDTLTLNPNLIEKSITAKTQAILPVHVYGNPCKIEEIEKIAKKYNLKVLYDAAHAFGVNYKGKSIVNYGDISVLSFHATKTFHTVEGGAIITNDAKLAHKISYLRNFGHKSPEEFWGVGINGKMSEFHAAMGLALLPKMRFITTKRKKIVNLYDKLLSKTNLRIPQSNPMATRNYSYYPVIFSSEKQLLEVKDYLDKHGIFPRRYFSPSLNELNYVKKSECPISEDISKRILCLPLFYGLNQKEVRMIDRLIKEKL